ncbi:MBL fold metallo-hydrolase [Pseudonocardia yuanmonensis]|uniref:MBL fold metallo-hydrolase n=1 Tax=Pseudonocardia yuanmonensis TaxID=1095914 RepID=A0ABP8WP29_9PSEU
MAGPDPTADPEGSSLTFVGTATTLQRLGPFTVLTDPNFLHRGERAYLGHGLTSRRRTEPALGPQDLPPLDAVVLSHLHGDHFDRRARKGLPPAVPIVTTPHAERRLTRQGFHAAAGLRTWETWETSRGDAVLRVTAVPGQHGPALVHRALPPVMGSVLELERAGRTVLRLYQTGDTLMRPFLHRVHERFGPPDVLVAHLGGTRVAGILVTMDARQGADLVEAFRPGTTIPVHFDDYDVFRSPLSHFTQELHDRGLQAGLRVLHRGETARLEPVAAPVRG